MLFWYSNSIQKTLEVNVRLYTVFRNIYHKLKAFMKRLIKYIIIKYRIFVLNQNCRNLLKTQRNTIFEHKIKISIVVPVFNTPRLLLLQMIKSVINQTYQNWQLCISDASDLNISFDIRHVIEDFCDDRISYKKIKNEGISENTNKCLDMAIGDYIALLDHDDLLTPDALYEVVKAINKTDSDILYSDEDKLNGNERIFPFFKPDWSPDLLNSQMYICHLLVVKKELLDIVGEFDKKFDGSQDYDMVLRLSEKTSKIYHISKILYSWRMTENSTSSNPNSKPYAQNAGLNALNAHLYRKYKTKAHATESKNLYVYDTRYDMPDRTKISIIIPTKDNVMLLNDCLESINEKSTFKNYEILIINNNSQLEETFEWFKEIQIKDKRVRIIDANFEFNWSKLNNLGIHNATGDVFIFLNNDTKVVSEDWLERLAENALRDETGIVGPLLLYNDNTIQHAGVVVGMGGWADHVFKKQELVHFGTPYVSPAVNRNVLAVTGACMAISRKTIDKIGNFNENFIVCGSDVEICIRAHNKGLFNLYNANVRLYHYESKTRDTFVPENDFILSAKHYSPYRENGDPYYNNNLDYYSTTPIERG